MARQILPGNSNPFKKGLDAIVKLHGDASGANSLAVRLMATELLGAIKLELSRPGSGKMYRVGKGKKVKGGKRAGIFHQASAPGEPPAPNRGRLRASAGMGIVGGVMRVGIGGYAKVPIALEFGTKTIKPRPYMRPAYASVKGRLGNLVVGALRAGMMDITGIVG